LNLDLIPVPRSKSAGNLVLITPTISTPVANQFYALVGSVSQRGHLRGWSSYSRASTKEHEYNSSSLTRSSPGKYFLAKEAVLKVP
jgi:hypothetical protein